MSPYIKRDKRSDSSDESFHSRQTFLPELKPRLRSDGTHQSSSNPLATGTKRVLLGRKSMNARTVPGEPYTAASAPIDEMLTEVAAWKRNVQSSLAKSRPAAKRLRVDWDAPRLIKIAARKPYAQSSLTKSHPAIRILRAVLAMVEDAANQVWQHGSNPQQVSDLWKGIFADSHSSPGFGKQARKLKCWLFDLVSRVGHGLRSALSGSHIVLLIEGYDEAFVTRETWQGLYTNIGSKYLSRRETHKSRLEHPSNGSNKRSARCL